jgi:hypothetical protein
VCLLENCLLEVHKRVTCFSSNCWREGSYQERLGCNALFFMGKFLIGKKIPVRNFPIRKRTFTETFLI